MTARRRARGAVVALAALAPLAPACGDRFPLWEPRAAPPVAALQTSWLGNSLGGGAGRRQLPRRLAGLHATGAGTLYVLSDDPSPEASTADALVLQDGAFAGRVSGLGGNTGRTPGPAAATIGEHLYVAVDQTRPEDVAGGGYPPAGTTWRCLRRYDRRGAPAPFPGGQGPDGSLVVVTQAPDRILGLAARGGRMLVSHSTAGGTVTAVDAAAPTERTDLRIPGVGPIAIGADGASWSLEGAGAARGIVQRDAAGLPTGARLAVPQDVGNPTALAVDPQGRLLVADGAPREQVLVFQPEPQGARLVRAVGIAGGLWATGGADLRPDRWLGVTAVTADDSGTIYVGMNLARGQGARIVAVASDGRPLWEHAAPVGLETAALDVGGEGGELDVYTSGARFRMDWGQPPGQQARWVGWTLDWRRSPEDPRLGSLDGETSARILRIQGKKFLALWSLPDKAGLFRLDGPGETAIPAALLGRGDAPGIAADDPIRKGTWLWRDRDGDGRPGPGEHEAIDAVEAWAIWIDERGGLWRASYEGGIEHLPVEGLDARGIPAYQPARRARWPLPAPFVRLQRFVYVADEDVAYVGGFTEERPNPWGGSAWVSLGSELVRYDGWTGRRRLRWRASILDAPDWQHGPRGFAVAGERVFLDHFNDTGVVVLDAATGGRVGRFVPGPEIGPGFHAERSIFPLQAFRRANGEYVLFGANPFAAQVTMFRLPGDWRE
jgi:hypothetical protein